MKYVLCTYIFQKQHFSKKGDIQNFDSSIIIDGTNKEKPVAVKQIDSSSTTSTYLAIPINRFIEQLLGGKLIHKLIKRAGPC